jgi:glycosyltransferase involved in cell wall biosynthesis
VASAFGLPAILFVHHTEVGRWQNRLTRPQLYSAELEAWATGWARAIVATSSSVREELHGTYRVPRQKVTAIHPRVAEEACAVEECIQDLRSVLADPDQAVVLYVGRLCPSKGLDILLEAMRQVGEHHPEAKLIVAGDGPLRGQLRKQAEDLEVPALFTGHLEGRALAATYRCADVVVVPGRYEPTGMSALEAVACGRPLVASDVGCLREVVPDNAALRVPAGEPPAMAQAIRRILDDPEAVERMSHAVAEHAQSLRWATAARRVRRLLDRIVSGDKTSPCLGIPAPVEP